MSEPVKGLGLFASLRRLSATALEVAQVRLALLGTEVELEKRRLFDALLWAAMALLILGTGVVMLCGFVILMLGDAYRLPAVGGLAFLLLTGGAMLLQKARQRLRTSSGMFSANIEELKRDCDALTTPARHEK